ncbi:UNVERIFIED_CONTAM: hypothetical protein HDU68_004058 [Siphonaria sp. JEL0065]|nr:hypothetical protein HDU68_004058 [Siphonaria sp. JEL0065]
MSHRTIQFGKLDLDAVEQALDISKLTPTFPFRPKKTGETKETPITQIFNGKRRSALMAPGHKESHTMDLISLEPVKTIEDALLQLTVPDIIPEYKSETLGISVSV